MDLYQSIFVRKSVRKYVMEQLDEKSLQNIEKVIINLEYLYPDLPIIIEIINNEKLRRSMNKSFLIAPYYLQVRADQTIEDYLNIGFVAEQVSLYLTEKGIGSCFIAGKEDFLLAFGKPGETKLDQCREFFNVSTSGLARRDSENAKRKELNQLCVYKETPVEEIITLLEAARLAPSAWNGQPWRFVVYRNRIHIFCRKSSGWMKHKREKYIGIGAMLSHIFLTAEELWLSMDVKKVDHIAEKIYRNNEYVISVILK